LMIGIFNDYLSNLFTMELFISEISKVVREFEINLINPLQDYWAQTQKATADEVLPNFAPQDHVVSKILQFFMDQNPERKEDYYFLTIQPSEELYFQKQAHRKAEQNSPILRKKKDGTFGLAEREYVILPKTSKLSDLMAEVQIIFRFNLNRAHKDAKKDKVQDRAKEVFAPDDILLVNVTQRNKSYDCEKGVEKTLNEALGVEYGKEQHLQIIRKNRDGFLKRTEICSQLNHVARAGDKKYKLVSYIRTVLSQDLPPMAHERA